MAYRCLVVENPARISCRYEQLVVETDRPHTVPIEDISALVLESRRCTLTSAALAALAQNGTAVYVCDEKHLPCGVMLPFCQHSRQLGVIQAQLGLTLPAKKRLWQQIVTVKIQNQAECLALCGKPEAAAFLFSRAKAVTSGDKENMEGVAAAFYFPALFGAGFTRAAGDGRNAALNYGYALLRGYAARCAAVYGFLPSVGLHHCSEVNQFNLADDLMEPFRPVVDLYVAANMDADAELAPGMKHALVNLLNADILSQGQHHSVAYALERLVQSLRRCVDGGTAPLALPRLLGYAPHTYE